MSSEKPKKAEDEIKAIQAQMKSYLPELKLKDYRERTPADIKHKQKHFDSYAFKEPEANASLDYWKKQANAAEKNPPQTSDTTTVSKKEQDINASVQKAVVTLNNLASKDMGKKTAAQAPAVEGGKQDKTKGVLASIAEKFRNWNEERKEQQKQRSAQREGKIEVVKTRSEKTFGRTIKVGPAPRDSHS